jgi:L-threonylcarbamoyladenylate synthase
MSACGFPLAAPSANPASQISPTTAEHVRRHLGQRIPLIVDGGPTPVGVESTVVDLTGERPRVLRQGMVSEEALMRIIKTAQDSIQPAAPQPTLVDHSAPAPLRSPGLLKKHYAPKAKLVIWQWRNLTELRFQLAALKVPSIHVSILALNPVPPGEDWGHVCLMPDEPIAYAQRLYAELHHCDEIGTQLIVAEAPPHSAPWCAIQDRLKRAAASQ